MKFPNYKVSMSLQHNDHKVYYETAENWIADNYWCQWKDEAAKQRAIETDSIWTLQWFPDTPTGSYSLAAPTLEELLEWANNAE